MHTVYGQPCWRCYSWPAVPASKRKGKGGGNFYTEINAVMDRQLKREMETTGFCREGFRETERMTGPDVFYIRGTCTETATDKDLQGFSQNTS
jgi:hypothetical protein